MIHVVLDTNIFHQEGLFSRNMQLLGRLATADKAVVYVPDLVKREYLSRRIADTKSKLQSINAGLSEILKKTNRDGMVYADVMETHAKLNSVAKGIPEAIEKDFEAWQSANNIRLIHFDHSHISEIFDDYFNGEGVFRHPKSREDLPDAFINACVKMLLNETKKLDVIIRDGTFQKHLKNVDGIEVFDGLDIYLASTKIVECIASLDAQSQRTDTLKQLFGSTSFQAQLSAYLRAADHKVSDIYIESGNVDGLDKLEMELIFGESINFPKASTIDGMHFGTVTQVSSGHFSLEVTFVASASVDYCGDYHCFTHLPRSRQEGIDMKSMDGDGICDLSEIRRVAFSGHIELRFEPYHSVETIALDAEYLHSQQNKIEIELDIAKAEVL
jgi:hypothetical protein